MPPMEVWRMPGLYRINGFLVYFWANESGEPVGEF